MGIAILPQGLSTTGWEVPLDAATPPAWQAWTYASSSTFTVPGDFTAVFPKDTRIKVTQSGTVKYFKVSADPTYAGGVTTVTLDTTSATLANSAISENYYSYAYRPQGFPDALMPSSGGGGWTYPQDFRLTLASATPVLTTDQLAKTTLYCTPYKGNSIALYDGSSVWNIRTSNEFSISNSGLATSTVYDVFCYDNAGTPTIELLSWTNATTRATALAYQNGVLVKSGATTRRYLGTIITDSASKFNMRFLGGVAAGAQAECGVWNYYNRVAMRFSILDNTNNWTYATATWRPLNNNAQNRLALVAGVLEDRVAIDSIQLMTAVGSAVGVIGVGLDSTNSLAADSISGHLNPSSPAVTVASKYNGYPGTGYHYLQLIEYASTTTITFYGNAGSPSLYHFGAMCDVKA